MKKFCVAIVLALIALVGFVGCEPMDKKDDSQFNVELNSKLEYLIAGEQYRLIPQGGANAVSLVWSSDDGSVASVKGGLITALKSGKCNVSVSGKSSKAVCKIVVCDRMVDSEFDKDSVDFNIKRFSNMQSAVEQCGTVAVMQGSYAENLVISEKVKIIAVGEVKVLSVYGDEFSLEGLSIQSSLHPQENRALVFAKKGATLDKCSISISTDESAETLQFGSAVEIASDGKKLVMKDCKISNFAIGANIYRFMGEVDIVANNFVNCGVGVVVNVRAGDKMIDDYPTSGVVRGNVFMKNNQNAKFLFSGDSYSGALDFYDFNSTEPKPNKK